MITRHVGAICGAALLAVLVAGCGGSDSTQPGLGSVTGQVSAGGGGVAGVPIALSGPATANTTTNANGQYGFSGLAPGAYEVQLALPVGYELAAGQTATRAANVQAGQSTQVDWTLVDSGVGPVEEVRMSGLAFSPAQLTIQRGTTVRWINDDNMSHTVTPNTPGQAGAWTDPGLMAPGASFQFTFQTAGSYAYHCQPHSAVMHGTIIVE